MYEMDDEYEGFEWNNADDSYHGVYSFTRKSKDGKKKLLFVCNFTPMEWKDYRIGVSKKKVYKLLLDSSEKKFGGEGGGRKENYTAVAKPQDERPYSIAFPLKPYEAVILTF